MSACLTRSRACLSLYDPEDDDDRPPARKPQRKLTLARLVKLLEIPDCGCPMPKVPFCTRGGRSGCDRRQETGDCDCPYLPGDPCKHVRELDPEDVATCLCRWNPELEDLFTAAAAEGRYLEAVTGALQDALMLRADDQGRPQIQADPPKPDPPGEVPSPLHLDRVERMRQRHHAGRGLWHKDDAEAERRALAIQMGKGRKQFDLTIDNTADDD